KKKKKKKKKKKAEVSENVGVFAETATAEQKGNDNQKTEHETTDEDITSILPTENFSVEGFPEVNSESFDDEAKQTEENEYDVATENNDLVTEWSIPTEKKVSEENKFNLREQETYQKFETTVKEQAKENDFADIDNTWQDDSDDWGFSKSNLSDEKEKNKEINTENKDEDFDDYYSMTAIGDNSYIGSSDLSAQSNDESEITPVISQTIPINIKNIPLIYDDSDEDTDDPYQNSILKD
ncbi:MAG: hypothetical protein MJ210_01190, partial [Alphaproteobacteria bacterium]|nr:hypothetical protein [Alphaproteobacteria bacterium]